MNGVVLPFGEAVEPVFDPISVALLAPDFSMEITGIDGVDFLFSDFCGSDVDDFVYDVTSLLILQCCYFVAACGKKFF